MRLMGSWGVAHNEVKGGFGGGRIRPGVVYILGEWEPSVPSGLVVVDKDAKVLFEPLICSFGLAVRLCYDSPHFLPSYLLTTTRWTIMVQH